MKARRFFAGLGVTYALGFVVYLFWPWQYLALVTVLLGCAVGYWNIDRGAQTWGEYLRERLRW